MFNFLVSELILIKDEFYQCLDKRTTINTETTNMNEDYCIILQGISKMLHSLPFDSIVTKVECDQYL
jgi:hypothetical protein